MEQKTKTNLQEKSDNSKAVSMFSDTKAAEAAQHSQLITLNHNLCCLLLCRISWEIEGELHLVGEAIGRQRVPSGRKAGFSSGSVLGTAYLETMWGSLTRLHPCNSVRYMPTIARVF